MRKVNRIILHYLGPGSGAQFRSAAEAVSTVRRWHLAQGFRDIGYHRVIAQNGSRAQGRPDAEIGAHAEGANQDSIGILACLGTTDKGIPQALLDALAREIRQVSEAYGVPLDRKHVIGHKDVSGPGGQTACPGQLYREIPRLIEMAKFGGGTARVNLDGQKIADGLLFEGQAYVAVRDIAAAFALGIAWDSKAKVVDLRTSS